MVIRNQSATFGNMGSGLNSFGISFTNRTCSQSRYRCCKGGFDTQPNIDIFCQNLSALEVSIKLDSGKMKRTLVDLPDLRPGEGLFHSPPYCIPRVLSGLPPYGRLLCKVAFYRDQCELEYALLNCLGIYPLPLPIWPLDCLGKR